MHAARLSESIIIRRKASTRDPLTGAESPGWVNDAPIWAEARPLRSREFVAQAQAESEIEVVITVHYQEGITADSRIIWRGDTYELTGQPVDVGAKKRWMELNARTTQNA